MRKNLSVMLSRGAGGEEGARNVDFPLFLFMWLKSHTIASYRSNAEGLQDGLQVENNLLNH